MERNTTYIFNAFDDNILNSIKEAYISECEEKLFFEWRYYYVKYKNFRPGRYGKYSWDKTERGCYDTHVLWTESKWSENSYQPYLYVADASLISRDYLGHYSILGDNYISCENEAIIISEIGTNEEVDRIDISQDENGIDQEDRIQKLKMYLKEKKI